MQKLTVSLILAIAILLINGCNLSMTSSNSSSDNKTSLSLSLTDAPISQFDKMWMTIEGVQVKPEFENAIDFTFNSTKRIDVLSLQDGKSLQLLNNVSVSSGDYEWIRLKIDTETIQVVDQFGRVNNVIVPFNETPLILNDTFAVQKGKGNDFTLDFNVKNSIVESYNNITNSAFFLRPSLRLVRNQKVGHIEGSADYAQINQSNEYTSCDYKGSVYVFKGKNAPVNDINVFDNKTPITTAAVSFNGEESAYTYKAAFLPEGEYTATYTCQEDDNERNDDIEFIGKNNVTVEAGQGSVVNF